MQQPGVADVHLGSLYLPLAEIGAPRLQRPHHERRFQDIEVTTHHVVGDAERPGQLGTVPGLGMVVGEHRPETFQHGTRDRDAELRDVAFEKGAHEVLPPPVARGMTPGREGERKSASQPQQVDVLRSRFRQRQTRQIVVRDPPGQRLGALAQQAWRCAAENQEPRRAGTAIGQHAQGRKELRPALHFVQHHEPFQRRQGEKRVRETGHIRRRLEIEDVGGSATALRKLPGERRLAGLPGSEERHHGAVPQQPFQRLQVLVSMNHSMILQ